MIVNKNINIIDKSSEIQEQSFTIKATAKAFKILSSGLYSNKILAVIRELSCNALDAHIAAGTKDTPFDIHLPTQFEPFFSVKDYGIGLSDSNIKHLYSTYFESTKTDSNDFIGALGLGSKSPFSYVDSFSVHSIFEGKKRFYTAFIGTNGCPSISSMGDGVDCDEHPGLEISFPVNPNDIRLFNSEAVSALSYFEVRPNFTSHKPDFPIKNYIRTEPTWKIVLSGGYTRAIQGSICYNILESEIINHLSEQEKMVFKLGVEIDFEIGQVEPNASREGLSYEPATVASIKNKLSYIFDILVDENKDIFADCKTEYEARYKFYTHIKGPISGFGYNSTNNEKKIMSKQMANFIMSCVQQNIIKLQWNNIVINNSQMEIKCPDSIFTYVSKSFFATSSRYSSKDTSLLTINCDSPNKIIYFDDLKIGTKSRIKHNNFKTDFPIYFKSKDIKKIPEAQTEFLAFVANYDYLVVKFISDLSKPPTEPKNPKIAADYHEVIRWDGQKNSSKYSSQCWFRENAGDFLENRKVVYYVPVYNNDVVKNLDFIGKTAYYTQRISNFDAIANFVRSSADDLGVPELKNTKRDIVGFRKKDLSLIEDYPKVKFINLLDYIEKMAKSKTKIKQLHDAFSKYSEYDFISEKYNFVATFVQDNLIKELHPDSDLTKLLVDTKDLNKRKSLLSINKDVISQGIKALKKIYNISDDIDSSISAKYNNVMYKKYPMLQYMQGSKLNNDMLVHIKDYVTHIDSQNLI